MDCAARHAIAGPKKGSGEDRHQIAFPLRRKSLRET